jgi:hypothetical protein
MSSFEHYEQELRELDHEIHKYAMLCGVNLNNRYEIEACLNTHHDSWSEDKARESLKGLLILRIKVETEMIESGGKPPSLLLAPLAE